nr:hypothetical protein [Candidatus Sigynarchaeota archaeon]
KVHLAGITRGGGVQVSSSLRPFGMPSISKPGLFPHVLKHVWEKLDKRPLISPLAQVFTQVPFRQGI